MMQIHPVMASLSEKHFANGPNNPTAFAFFGGDQLQVRMGSSTLAKQTPETDLRNRPRNRPAKETPEANFPSRAPHFETHLKYNSVVQWFDMNVLTTLAFEMKNTDVRSTNLSTVHIVAFVFQESTWVFVVPHTLANHMRPKLSESKSSCTTCCWDSTNL